MATIESNFESICIDPNDDLVLYKKEIIRSRIEKFLYAICSLDNDDLPTPLSRIEEMYKCLVMGVDFITFTPLSRDEKFVMAMLGAYDVELLPTPISRSEILMRKIAKGDNNLDDVDNLQSRYEFLLAYIIKAGGFNGGSGDFYYNLTSLTSSFTTIYGTLDKPVKNAVLKGQTLVNMSSLTGVTTLKPGDVIFIENGGMKINTTYTIMFNCSNVPSTNFVEIKTMMDNTQITQVQQNVSVGYNKFTIRTHTSKETNRFRFKNDTSSSTDFIFSELLILEGDHTNENIPYFEGMASVKMPTLTTTGKNVFDGEYVASTYSSGKAISVGNEVISYPHTTSSNKRGICNIVKVIPNTEYCISIHNKPENTVILGTGYANIEDIKTQSLSVIHVGSVSNSNHTTLSLTTPSNCNYMIIGCYTNYTYEQSGGTVTFKEPPAIQLEIGSTATPYEPYKSTTVTIDSDVLLTTEKDHFIVTEDGSQITLYNNEEVELRGIGDIKDELNLVTGELTQRIQERVFDGSENWIIGGTGTNYIMFRCENYTDMVKSSSAITCDKYAYNKIDNAASNLSVTYSTTTGKICIVTSQTDLSIDNFKAKLNTDKPIIQYQLAEPIVKTVDLSILDQDGKKTKLNTFDDITHVTVSSEGLVPTGDIDIARPIQFVDYSLDNGEATLYNTIDYPVKSAILRGQTLVNLPNKLTTELSNSERRNDYKLDSPLTAGKKYLICFNGTVENGGDLKVGALVNNSTWGSETVTWVNGHNKVIIIISTNSDYIRISSSLTKVTTSEVMVIEYQDGMENWDIPYFEGMQSVKMPVLTTTGKNMFDINKFKSIGVDAQGYYIPLKFVDNDTAKATLKLKPNTKYVVTGTYIYTGSARFVFRINDGAYQNMNNTFETDATGVVNIKIGSDNVDVSDPSKIEKIMIVESTLKDIYEPYKSNILTCNEEVELRGIGDIKDELNLTTGELTQRIGEFVFDGSSDELWGIDTNSSGFKRFVSRVKKTHSNYLEITNWLPTANKSYWSINENGFYIGTNGSPVIVFNTNDSRYNMSITELENYLSQNPLIVQYPLIESVKTVELTTVDQDNKETKLSTFDDITHVTVSSEGLVPTGKITVATKNATDVIDASVMSLRMDDILKSQGTLEGSANAQSDDIDVTMLGTTDIYEQLL